MTLEEIRVHIKEELELESPDWFAIEMMAKEALRLSIIENLRLSIIGNLQLSIDKMKTG